MGLIVAKSEPEGAIKPTWRRKIVTVSAAMLQVLAQAKRVAATKATVLIQGETGTGKELLARFVHDHSDRAGNRFVAVNCSALPETLVESEFFGHVKGAFTGAYALKPGKFELASGGTLFLDEVGELASTAQPKLLRAIQEGQVDHVGGQKPVAVNSRIVAATSNPLDWAVREKGFSEALYYRLNVINLKLPPLRQRPEDIAPLAKYFLDKYSREHKRSGLTLTAGAVRALQLHAWPGNVRELENCIERAVLLCQSERIEAADLLLGLCSVQGVRPATAPAPGQTIKEVERSAIYAALSETNGNRTRAAKVLGINVRTLRRDKMDAEMLAEFPPKGGPPSNPRPDSPEPASWPEIRALPELGDGFSLKAHLAEIERELIQEAMVQSGNHYGQKARAARLLGINRTTLIEKIKKWQEV